MVKGFIQLAVLDVDQYSFYIFFVAVGAVWYIDTGDFRYTGFPIFVIISKQREKTFSLFCIKSYSAWKRSFSCFLQSYKPIQISIIEGF